VPRRFAAASSLGNHSSGILTGIGFVGTRNVYHAPDRESKDFWLTSYIIDIHSVKMKRSSTVPVPVRLDDATQLRIRRAAKKLGSNASSVIRFSILNQLQEIESGRIILAPDTKETV
jgi:hypothetical protein